MNLQLVPSVFVWVEVWGHRKPEENLDVVVGEELCDVVCCMGSGVVVLKYSVIQLLMPEMKQQKTKNKKKAFVLQ